jgi:hypothetical protein
VRTDDHKICVYPTDRQIVVPQQVDDINDLYRDPFQAFVKGCPGYCIRFDICVLDQTPSDCIIGIYANVTPQNASGDTSQSRRLEHGYPHSLNLIPSSFIEATP